MDEALLRINEIEDGDTVTVTVPVGGNEIQVTGTAHVDANGTVSIQLSEPYAVRD